MRRAIEIIVLLSAMTLAAIVAVPGFGVVVLGKVILSLITREEIA